MVLELLRERSLEPCDAGEYERRSECLRTYDGDAYVVAVVVVSLEKSWVLLSDFAIAEGGINDGLYAES